jgi:hypothetical protein
MTGLIIPLLILRRKKEATVSIVFEAAWKRKTSLNAVDNAKIYCCCLYPNADFSVVYPVV